MHHSIESVTSASTISILPPSGAAESARRVKVGRATVAVRLAAVRRAENIFGDCRKRHAGPKRESE